MDIIEALIGFVLFGIVLYAGIGSIGTIHSVNNGNCATAANGTLENCSLSNADYNQLNNTQNYYSNTFGILVPLQWLLVVGVIISALFILAGLTHRRS